ncbi:MAG: peptidoglycan-associated lipoprotein Pal [Alphaproteobacteria bacterium]|nr:peptidoglycan-associated lipoprotein Pal [Alphaproteobacteria bacterium]MCK5519372.1 peptidoglycan-associated lipoprotein Pal [Alphaproteobacteria bacterium]MCK5555695.1 peptidoglycan-associated lipoprotein Pal [Alphaproteobacteria bacterium]
MSARILSLLAVMVLVAGCSKPQPDVGSLSTDADMTAVAPIMTDPIPSVDQGPVPGTQQDLVIAVGDRVFFSYDKYDLASDARTTIERQTQWLRRYPHINISIEGHCDERGTREYNLALGEKRAASVKNYLIALGIESSRIQTLSYGKERPAVMGSDETSWAQNRRGVVVVQ